MSVSESGTYRLIYCPYTDRELPESQTSREHIIPLSLGGVDGFEIPVDAAFNSMVGTNLDGALANDFFIALRRTEYDARGHSGKEPMATSKHASYGKENHLAQVQLHRKKGLRVWDVRDRETKKNVGSGSIRASLNVDLPVRFTAKVGLAAGYYIYGDLFREHVDHRQLRDVMRIDPTKLDLNKSLAELGLDHLTLRVDHYLHEEPSDPDSPILCLRKFCQTVRGSVVVLLPGTDCFRVAVGILGQYLTMINVPANTASFPNDGVFAWGHVMAVVDRKLKRCSWMDGLKQWVTAHEQAVAKDTNI